jgi:hypothetical protein
MKRFVLIIYTILLFHNIANAGKGPGTSGFEFLNIPVGAREISMGSGSAVAHGANAYWWNPAGLAYLERNCLSFMYNNYLDGITQQRAGFSFPMKNQSVGAVNLSMLSITGIEGYNWNDIATGEITASDYYFSYTQAKRFSYGFMGGMTLKAITEKLDTEDAMAFGVDLGLISSPVENFWFSLGAKNLGISGKFITTSEPMPMSAFSGVGVRINKFTLFSSDVYYMDSEIKYGAGVEFDLWDLLYFRGGWNNISDLTDTFRMGVGWKLHSMQIDYALAPYGKLGTTSRIDINIKFGLVPLIESIYRNARKYYKEKYYKRAWVEFNKVNSLSPGYKKVTTWIKKCEFHINQQVPEQLE